MAIDQVTLCMQMHDTHWRHDEDVNAADDGGSETHLVDRSRHKVDEDASELQMGGARHSSATRVASRLRTAQDTYAVRMPTMANTSSPCVWLGVDLMSLACIHLQPTSRLAGMP